MEAYEEGQPITADQLMLWARNKYDLLRDKGTWNAPTDEEEKIIALQAQVKAMVKKLKHTKNSSKPNSKFSSKKSEKQKQTKKKEKLECLPPSLRTSTKRSNGTFANGNGAERIRADIANHLSSMHQMNAKD